MVGKIFSSFQQWQPRLLGSYGGSGRIVLMTAAILYHIQSLGYIVKEFRINVAVEYHAMPLRSDTDPQVARCNDGEDDESAYRAACLLAQAIGIDLEG